MDAYFWAVEEFSLVRSVPSPHGSSYKVVQRMACSYVTVARRVSVYVLMVASSSSTRYCFALGVVTS
jgi:hypothetical protein